MTEHEVRELDEHSMGAPPRASNRSDAGLYVWPNAASWEDIIVAVPDLSLNDLMSYEERKQREWRRASGSLLRLESVAQPDAFPVPNFSRGAARPPR